MRITQKYSHLNGEEYLIVHQNDLYNEIKEVIDGLDADTFRTKISKEKMKMGNVLLAPIALHKAFEVAFNIKGWKGSRYSYYITLDRELMGQTVNMTDKVQKKFLIDKGDPTPINTYNQIDFVKNKIAVEVQFGRNSLVAYDLFVKHMLFYTGGKINLGIEILPTKAMQAQMSKRVAYFEEEVYNVMRHGRNSPPVPLLILGVEP